MQASLWFKLHLVCAIGADILMLLAGVVAVLFLWQDFCLRHKKLSRFYARFASIRTLDDLGVRLFTAAFALMTGGMVAGSVLAHSLWGQYWYLDARQVWSVLVWLLFAGVLFARFLAGWRGRRASVISILGVVLLLSGHLVLSTLTRTQHREIHYDG
jgi:ABC-type uncharacterized transport system permease subunit